MDKRYQVFVSSTYTDLHEVRGEIFKTLMALDCIPAGMENFPAMDLEQFEFIKKVIDDCDYYLIIVGGRYGSVSPAGVSYTEMEYDYAVAKGMKVIAFLHSDIGSLPSRDTESDTELRFKLEAFREKLKTGRLIKFWNSAEELNALVATSLMQTIKVHPAVGWVRANRATSEETLQELNDLRKELAELKSQSAEAVTNKHAIIDLAGLEDSTNIRITATRVGSYNEEWRSLTFKWKEIFARLAPIIQIDHSVRNAQRSLGAQLWPLGDRENFYDISIADEAFGVVRAQFIALDLISVGSIDGSGSVAIRLTERGERTMLEVITARKQG